jgi:hypothetical protein
LGPRKVRSGVIAQEASLSAIQRHTRAWLRLGKKLGALKPSKADARDYVAHHRTPRPARRFDRERWQGREVSAILRKAF